MELDLSDYKLLCALRDESRLSLRELGAVAKLSAPAVANRLKRLEQLGIIKGYTVVLSDSAFSLRVQALFFSKIAVSKREEFVKYMTDCLCVSALFKIASDYAYMSSASFDCLASLNSFHEYLEQNFGETKVQIVLKTEFIHRAPMCLKKLEEKFEK